MRVRCVLLMLGWFLMRMWLLVSMVVSMILSMLVGRCIDVVMFVRRCVLRCVTLGSVRGLGVVVSCGFARGGLVFLGSVFIY